MFGHRPEGKRVHNMDPIVQITPYLMPMRCDAQVFLDHDLEYEPMMRYIAQKGREGVKITFLEILIASYVRGVSQVPEVNRFIMNRQYYNRKELTASFTILMDTPDGSLEENALKIFFDPSDTIYDVSARVKQAITQGRKAEDPGFAVKLAGGVLKVPLLPNLVVDPDLADGVARLLSGKPVEKAGSDVLVIELVDRQWYVHKDEAVSSDYRAAFAQLLAALAPHTPMTLNGKEASFFMAQNA